MATAQAIGVPPGTSLQDQVPHVDIYAQLPLMSSDDEERRTWVSMLRIPITSLNRIDPMHPIRWLLFACGAMLGTECGSLSLSEDPSPQFDCNSTLPTTTTHIYYFHIPPEYRESLVLTEPTLRDGHTGKTFSDHQHDSDIRFRVLERDDHACVVTGIKAPLVDCVHLIKGNEYIEQLTRRATDRNDVIDDADDIRNAITVSKYIHCHLGTGAAFMKKPNFAYPQDTSTWECHVLADGVAENLRLDSTHPGPIRVPQDKSDWPPDLVFHQVYAAAIWTTFGNLSNHARERIAISRKPYYIDSGKTDALQCGDEKRVCRLNRRVVRGDESGNDESDNEESDDEINDDESIPQFALWQNILPPEMQRRVYDWARRTAEQKARAEVDSRIEAWLSPDSSSG